MSSSQSLSLGCLDFIKLYITILPAKHLQLSFSFLGDLRLHAICFDSNDICKCNFVLLVHILLALSNFLLFTEAVLVTCLL